MKLQRETYPETPKGKRTVKRNIWGNTNAYVSGRLFWEFGTDEKSAKFWGEGETLDAAYNECWLRD